MSTAPSPLISPFEPSQTDELVALLELCFPDEAKERTAHLLGEEDRLSFGPALPAS